MLQVLGLVVLPGATRRLEGRITFSEIIWYPTPRVIKDAGSLAATDGNGSRI
jgi:hypothetical protein